MCMNNITLCLKTIMSLVITMILVIIQIFASFLSIPVTASSSSSPHGFTIDLVQRPTNSSSSSRLSTTRLESLESAYADIMFDTTSYLMKLQIGTPPVEFEALLDTGSDVVWLQCLPCGNCIDQQAPVFDPSQSSTYKEKTCGDHSCPYVLIYADQTYSKGIYATETVRIHSSSGQPFVMAQTTFGCGHNNTGLTSTTNSGLVGLGRGSASLISQMGSSFQGRLSYCFAGKGTSKISFGANALVVGDGTISTTMFQKDTTFYYLNLEALSVGKTRVETLGTTFHATDGNMIIDSGTTFTLLPRRYCDQVKEVVNNAMTTLKRASFTGQMLCYNADSIKMFPVITMHFSGGADLVLDRYNMWIQHEGVVCLAVSCVDAGSYGVFGNRAQNNFFVGYDPSAQLVSFKHTNDCNDHVIHDDHVIHEELVLNDSAANSTFWIGFLVFFLCIFCNLR